VATVEDVLRRTGIDPAMLILEITETSLVNDPETAAARLEELHSLGVRLAIDDFGTGYSSLSYLRQFPTDILKIDSSFIQTIKPDGPMPDLLRGILDLARTLGIETIAEGIEDAHQLSKLRSENCEQGQGFLLAEPMSTDDARRLFVEQTAGRDEQQFVGAR
jgi:EAL domain-containing protein (putative c-di-GMP-specific phosphodiesterase class I)